MSNTPINNKISNMVKETSVSRFQAIDGETAQAARRMVKRRAKWLVSDDLLADCDAKIWENYSDKPLEERRKLFLCAIANAVRDEIRRRGLRLARQPEIARKQENAPSGMDDPAINAERQESWAADLAGLESLLSRMSRLDHEIVFQYYFGEKSTAHIAQIYGFREDSVRQKLTRSRKWLRENWPVEPPL